MRSAQAIRRNQIIRAAMEIVSREGLQSLTMLKIGRRIGITDAALYRHFTSKKEILLAMISEIGESVVARIEGAIGGEDDPTGKLEGALRAHLEYLDATRGVTRIIFSEAVASGDPDLVRELRKVIKRYLGVIRGILRRGVRVGRFRKGLDVETASMTFLGLIQGVMVQWSVAPRKFPLARRGAALFRTYMQGILAWPAGVPPRQTGGRPSR